MKKFSMLMAAALVGLSASAADYYLIGGFNNWALKDANCHFTEVSETEYVLDYNGTLTSGFKINDGTWSNDAANWGSNGANLVLGQAYTMTAAGNSGNISMAENIANPHLVFDPTTATLTITGQSQEAVYTYDIWGNLDGGEDWSETVLKESNGVWTADVTVAADANFGIRKLSEGAQVDWISHDGDGVVVLNTPMQCKVEGTNFSIAAGEYSFAFDPEAMTLTVTDEGGDVPPVVDPSEVWGVVGDFNEWGWDGDQKDMTMVSEGVWTITLPSYQGDFRFAKANSTTNYVGSAENATFSINADGEYETKAGGKNFRFPETVENVTLTLDLNNNTLTVSGMAAVEYPEMYLVGEMTGWGADAAYQMATSDGITYTLTCAMEAGKEFKFFGGDWNVRELTGAGENLINDKVYTLGAGQANMTLAYGGEEVTFTLVRTAADWSVASLTIKGQEEGDVPTPPTPGEFQDMYLVGAVNGWSTSDAYKMTTTDGVTYTLTCALAAQSDFKFFGGDWDNTPNFGGAGVLGNSSYDLTLGGGNMQLEFGGDAVTFTLVVSNDFQNATLVVTGQDESIEVKDTFAVAGAFNSWNAEANVAEANEEGIATVYNVMIGTGEFKIVVNGGWRGAGQAITCDEPTVIEGDGANMTIANAVENGNYDLSYNFNTNELTISFTGTVAVESINAANGEAIYFNLQGARVANPENGLYIRVANGKAQKVVVK